MLLEVHATLTMPSLALASLSAKKKPCAKFTPGGRKVQLVGGDNRAEALVSSVKQSLRRTNLLGRSHPISMHVDMLYTRFVSQKPGLLQVLRALRMYREARLGQMGANPKSFLKIEDDNEWL
eukprot:Skav214425  [mRNA]  locus=scaffold586:297996:298361:+ [translate_table: standard]